MPAGRFSDSQGEGARRPLLNRDSPDGGRPAALPVRAGSGRRQLDLKVDTGPDVVGRPATRTQSAFNSRRLPIQPRVRCDAGGSLGAQGIRGMTWLPMNSLGLPKRRQKPRRHQQKPKLMTKRHGCEPRSRDERRCRSTLQSSGIDETCNVTHRDEEIYPDAAAPVSDNQFRFDPRYGGMVRVRDLLDKAEREITKLQEDRKAATPHKPSIVGDAVGE